LRLFSLTLVVWQTGKSDPFCKVRVGKYSSFKTKHIAQTLNPVWSEEFFLAYPTSKWRGRERQRDRETERETERRRDREKVTETETERERKEERAKLIAQTLNPVWSEEFFLAYPTSKWRGREREGERARVRQMDREIRR
jgi:hypothetical protein